MAPVPTASQRLTPADLRTVYVSSLIVDEIKRIIKSSEILKYVWPTYTMI